MSGTVAFAAPVMVNGARFDAPQDCKPSERALVCKVEGQQLELWINRKLVADYLEPDEPFTQKMAWFQGLHESAVTSVMRSTFNDKRSSFSNYGNYPALGTTLPGKGSSSSPAVRFASVLYEDSYWEFLEVTAARTPAIDGLSASLERSLQLPKADPAKQPVARKSSPASAVAPATPTTGTTASAPPAVPDTGASPLSVTFNSTALSFDHPGYMAAKVISDTAGDYAVQLSHKTRKTGGPAATIRWQRPAAATTAAAQAAALRDAQVRELSAAPQTATLSRFGSAQGQGYALLGVPKPAAGALPTESLYTLFVADVNGGRLEVRMNAEQAYAGEAQTVWAMIAQTLTFRP